MSNQIDYTAEYDNSARVENSAELVDRYISDAADFRESFAENADLDLIYGPGERNMMDIFWPDDELGRDRKSRLVIFIHGGYWQRMDRSSFSHLAKGLNARGIAVAMPSYTLCPDIKIDGIITEIRRACLVLFQTYRQKLTVVGHSAGGHLAACMMATNWQTIHQQLPHNLIASGMGLSGLYDLTPLCQTPINEAVGMDEQQARESSPLFWTPEAFQKFEAWAGAEESGEYHRQSRELADRWSLLGTPTQFVPVPGANHFTIVDELVKADSPMVNRIVELMDDPELKIDLPDVDPDTMSALLSRFAEEAELPIEPEQEDGFDTVDDPQIETDIDDSSEHDNDSLAMPAEALSETDNPQLSKQQPDQATQADQADATSQKQAE
jgi:arylformamidase